ATPVEAIDQLAANAVLAELLGQREASRGARDTETAGTKGDRHVCPVEFRVAIFGLPEQARQEAQGILVASTDEPTTLSGARQVVLRCGSSEYSRVGRLPVGLRVTARDVAEQARQNHVADATANRPLPVLLLRSDRPYDGNAVEPDVALHVHEVVIAEHADHPAIKLVVAA